MDKENNYKQSIKRGTGIGLIFAFIIQLWVILSLYFDSGYSIYYGMAFFAFIITFSHLKNSKIRYFFIGLMFFILSFIIATIVFDGMGIIDAVFRHIHGTNAKMWAGDGFGIMVVYMFNLAGGLIGIISAFFYSCYRHKIGLNRG